MYSKYAGTEVELQGDAYVLLKVGPPVCEASGGSRFGAPVPLFDYSLPASPMLGPSPAVKRGRKLWTRRMGQAAALYARVSSCGAQRHGPGWAAPQVCLHPSRFCPRGPKGRSGSLRCLANAAACVPACLHALNPAAPLHPFPCCRRTT